MFLSCGNVSFFVLLLHLHFILSFFYDPVVCFCFLFLGYIFFSFSLLSSAFFCGYYFKYSMSSKIKYNCNELFVFFTDKYFPKRFRFVVLFPHYFFFYFILCCFYYYIVLYTVTVHSLCNIVYGTFFVTPSYFLNGCFFFFHVKLSFFAIVLLFIHN